MKWNLRSILDMFRDRSDQPASDNTVPTSPVDSMSTPDIIDAIGLRGDKIRPAIGIPEDEPESKDWRDVTGTAHLYIRGALQSLERMKDGQPDAEAAETAIGTINFAAKSPDGFFGSTAGETAKIAQKILHAEQDGETNLTNVLSAEELGTILVGLDDANQTVQNLAAQNNAPNDVQTYAKALDRAVNHYHNATPSIHAKINPEFHAGLDDVS